MVYLFAFRNLWTRKARTLLTLSGVALGVALVLAVGISTASALRAFEVVFTQTPGHASLSVTSAASNIGTTVSFRATVLRDVQAFPGVANAVATISDLALLLGKDGREVNLTILGIDPVQDRQVRTYELVLGRFPDAESRSREIVLVKSLADEHGISLNDRIELITSRGSGTCTVVGLLADTGAARINLGRIGFVTLDVARDVFERDPFGKVDQIDLVAEPSIAHSPEKLEQLKAGLQAHLGDSFIVAYPQASGKSMAGALSSMSIGMSLLGFTALIVSGLLTFNTFSMIAVERIHEWGLLRALGMGRSQLLRWVLIEALFLALLGTLLGLGLGWLLAIPLTYITASMFGGSVPIDQVVVPPTSLVTAVVAGILVTLVGSFKPAWDVTRTTPMEALRARAQKRAGWFARHSWQFGLVLVGLAVADQIVSEIPGRGPFMPDELFLVAVYVGMTLLVPVTLGLFERLTRRVMSAVYGVPGRLGSLNLRRNTSRAALTVSVILIGVSMTVAMGGMEVSFRAEADRWMESALGGDLWIGSFAPMQLDLAPRIAAADGIGALTPQRFMYVNIVGGTNVRGFTSRHETIVFRAIDPATYRSVTALRLTESQDRLEVVWSDFLSGDAVLITGFIQEMYHVGRGDTLRIRTARGEHDFRVAGIVNDMFAGGRAVAGTWDDMQRWWGHNDATYFVARFAPGVGPQATVQALKDSIGKSRHLTFQSGEQYRSFFKQIISQFYLLLDATVFIAVVVGALGVVNTMTMSVLERVREIALLRSLGLTRAQVMSMVLAEAAVMGVIAAVLGVATGLALSMTTVKMANTIGWKMAWVWPTTPIIAGAVVALIVSQLAAIYPAWRAVKTVMAEAIQSE